MKTAIITGSSRGIGLSTVNLLLEKGFKVAGWSRSGSPVKNDNFIDVKADVSKLGDVEKALETSVSFLGNKVDILVNNAGYGIQEPLLQSKPENFDGMLATNVSGLYYCTRLIAPLMVEQKKGHIFNIASIAGTTGIETMGGYCASKFAVRGFSLSIFKELRKFGIKVSCINPGSVNTNFFDDFAEVTADDSMMHPHDIAQSIWYAYDSRANFHVVELELRPLSR